MCSVSSVGALSRSNLDCWKPELERNVRRDVAKHQELRALGWRVSVVRTCELETDNALRRAMQRVLTLRENPEHSDGAFYEPPR